jgi:hypothetical protein
MSPEDQILRLQALSAIQTADVSSLLNLLSEFRAVLIQSLPELSERLPEIGERFLQLRKELLHAGLEQLENTNPELAAHIQKQIDDTSTLFPFDYD